MTDHKRLTGLVASRIVAELMTRQAAEQPKDSTPAIRVKGFSAGEVEVMLRAWTQLSLPHRSSPVKVVVAARSEDDGFLSDLQPPQQRLAADEMLTTHRNALVVDGTILVEVGPQPDAEGLDALFTVRDDSVLADPAGGEAVGGLTFEARFELLIDIVWQNRVSSPSPACVHLRAAQVYNALKDVGAAPSLRQWISFVDRLADRATEETLPWDTGTADREVGRALERLGLFPDPTLFNHDDSPRRVARNYFASTLSTPENKQLRDGELLERIDRLEAPGGHVLRPTLKDDMRAVANESDPSARERIDLEEWLWLFSTKRTVLGLGDKIRRHIVRAHPERLGDWDDLEVTVGLNDRVRAAAETLVAAEATGDDPAPFMLLSRRLQRQVNKLLARTESVADPLVAILRSVYRQAEEIVSVGIEHVGAKDESRYSRRVFALLYSQTLSALSEGASAVPLSIDPSLLEIGPLMDAKKLSGDRQEDSSKEADGWAPVMFRVVGRNDAGNDETVDSYSWDAHDHASFARLLQEPVAAFPVPFTSSAELDNIAVCDGRSLTSGDRAPSPESLRALMEHRSTFFAAVAASGLSWPLILRYVDDYVAELERVTPNLVPRGMPVGDLEYLVNLDTGRSPIGRAAVLGTHPIRLRWFGEHLKAIAALIGLGLENKLSLNEANEELFFARLDELAPFDQPALLSTGFKQQWISARSSGPHAEYAQVTNSGSHDDGAVGGIDKHAVQVLARVVRRYLSEFPHKYDGLELLVLDREGDAELVSALVKEILETSDAPPVLRLHVAAPVQSHERISMDLARRQTQDDRREQLLPSFTTTFHEWNGGELSGVAANVDLALAADLFGAKPHVQSKTKPVLSGTAGSFRPWLDEAIDRSDPPGHAVSIRRLIPALPDRLLELWSSLNVRRCNAAMVGDDPRSVDYLELTVSFAEQEGLFRQLHDLSHWVVTLDRFIDREHFDALDDPPEIIQVQEGVGLAQALTLTVSSGTGRSFVTERLCRRLGESGLGLVRDPVSAERIANRLYDLGRHVAPSLLLRALGLGRSAEETIGLVVARWKAKEWDPVPEGTSYVEIWVTLDDFTHWFGGSHELRSDLLRLRFFPDGHGSGVLDAEVVEAKFRQTNDLGRAYDQVRRTAQLIRGALDTSADRKADDLDFWLREMERAISQTSKQPHDAEDLPTFVRAPGLIALPSDRDLVAQIRSGRFALRSIGGTVVHTNSAGGVDAEERVHNASGDGVLDGIRLVRTSQQGLLTVLNSLAGTSADTVVEDRARPNDGKELPVESLLTTAREPEEDRPTETVPADIASDPSIQPTVSPSTGDRQAQPLPPEPKPVHNTGGGMSDAELNVIYQRMLDTFDQYNIRVTRPQMYISEGPGFFVTRFEPGPGVKVAALRGLVDEIKVSLGLSRDQAIRHYVDGGAFVFEVPKSEDQRFPVFADEMWAEYPWDDTRLEAPIGRDILGEIVCVDFSSPNTPHLLIAGMTGAGKSVALETLLLGLVERRPPSQLRLNLIDPKGTELTAFEGSPYLEGEIGWLPEDAIAVLGRLAGEMDRRYRELLGPAKKRDISQYNASVDAADQIPWQIVVLDEYADLTSDKEDRRDIEEPLQRIAQKGRACGIHLVVATQRPSAEVITSEIRSNLPAQLALRVFNAIDSRIVIGEGGAEALAGRGDALFRTPGGTRRIQCGVVQQPK